MCEEPKKKRFKQLTDEQLNAKRKGLENNHTLNAEKCADKAFKDFLRESGAQCVDYYYYEEQELAKWLSKFWFGA